MVEIHKNKKYLGLVGLSTYPLLTAESAKSSQITILRKTNGIITFYRYFFGDKLMFGVQIKFRSKGIVTILGNN